MERKNLKCCKSNKTKKSNFFQSCFLCVSESKSTEFIYDSEQTKNNLTYSGTPTDFFIDTELTLKDLKSEKGRLHRMYNRKVSELPFPRKINPANDLEKKKKDEIVKSILGKYLAVKRQEMIDDNENKGRQHFFNTMTSEDENYLKIERIDDDSGTLVLGSLDFEKFPATEESNLQFPTKIKSAPTNSITRDSLIDICSKMNCYCDQQQKTANATNQAKQNRKKKLELVFNATNEPRQREKKAFPLEYKISCEGNPLVVGMLKPNEEKSADESPLKWEITVSPKDKGKCIQD